MKLNVEITNLAEFITATEVVLKKAEELQKAIQRLNDIDLLMRINEKDIRSGNIATASIDAGQLSSRLQKTSIIGKEQKPMENLAKEVEDLVKVKATQALVQSETYQEAILLVGQNASLTEHGQAIKKAIQAEIASQALNSKINYNSSTLTTAEEE